MKIVLTGAGGGHFYPLIAVAERIRKESFIQKIISPEIYFLSDNPYDEKALFDLQIKYIQIPAGKLRLYPSLDTILDMFKTFFGIIIATQKLYSMYPDVVFAKGGYASFPVLFAARILSIPVVVHESDTVAGRTTMWAGKFASRVAVSYKDAIKYFDNKNIALTGQPIREKIIPEDGFSRVYTKKDRPVICILGGSQGSQRINDVIVTLLPTLLKKYDIVHQVGTKNLADIKSITGLILENNEYKDRYFVDGFIDVSLFYPKVDLVITRAGSSLFELAMWQLPSIIIPIPETISRDQRSNAYAYVRTGAAIVLEEGNLTENILVTSIEQILQEEFYTKMVKACLEFDYSRNAATLIARELIGIGLSHQEE